MISSLSTLLPHEILVVEATTAADMPPKATDPVDLFLGRVQPLTKAHMDIINNMTNPVIALVRGTKKEDVSRNPFDPVYQRHMIHKVCPTAKVIEVPTGYVPDIIAELRTHNMEVKNVHAGSDRVADYARMINGVNAQLPDTHKIDANIVEIKRTGEDVSATKVRTALKAGDEATFQKMMPLQLHDEYHRMKSQLTEDEGGPTNSTAGCEFNINRLGDQRSNKNRKYKTFAEYLAAMTNPEKITDAS